MAKNRGLTLVELLIVIMIIGVLAGVVLSINFQQQLKKARDSKRKVDIEQIRSALEMYRSDAGSYPTTAILTSPICGGNLTYLTNTYLIKPCDPKNVSPNQYTFSGGGASYSLTVTLEQGGSYTGTPLGSTCTGGGCP